MNKTTISARQSRKCALNPLFCNTMGPEQSSALLVLAIVVIIVVIWLPNRTIDSMRKVMQHRQDRLSPSLHLIDVDTADRFSDGKVVHVRGNNMQPSLSGKPLSNLQIARIRQLRRNAARRRLWLVLFLLCVTIAMIVVGVLTPVSLWFSLIPASLTAIVLCLGIRVSKKARRWEANLAQQKAQSRSGGVSHHRSAQLGSDMINERLHEHDERVDRSVSQPSRKTMCRSSDAGHAVTNNASEYGVDPSQTPTDVMLQSEIRLAIMQAQGSTPEDQSHNTDKSYAGSQHHAGHQPSTVQSHGANHPQDAAVSQQPVKYHTDQADTTHQQSNDSSDIASPTHTSNSQETKEVVSATSEPDSTKEIGTVRIAAPLDVFDMATRPELISFSLGHADSDGISVANDDTDAVIAVNAQSIAHAEIAERADLLDDGKQAVLAEEATSSEHHELSESQQFAAAYNGQEVVESLEIKSYRQVARAIPQQDLTASGELINDYATNQRDERSNTLLDNADNSHTQHSPQSFHEQEVTGKVDSPQSTQDSLSMQLEEILARRAQ